MKVSGLMTSLHAGMARVIYKLLKRLEFASHLLDRMEFGTEFIPYSLIKNSRAYLGFGLHIIFGLKRC